MVANNRGYQEITGRDIHFGKLPDYLNLSRIENNEVQPLPTRIIILDDIIKPLLDSLEVEFSANKMTVVNNIGVDVVLNADANMVREVFENLTGNAVKTTGAGRTDTGVHARVFFAHFDTNFPFDIDEKNKFIYRMNGILPRDIVINDLLPVRADANARFDAISRTYHYYVCTAKNPFYDGQVYYLFPTPDIGLMNEGANIIKAATDFSAFSKTGSNTRTNHCKVFDAIWETQGDLIIFRIKADRFLDKGIRSERLKEEIENLLLKNNS